MTLLSIYTERLGGFTSGGKQVLTRGGAINGRFRFFLFFLQATMGRAGGEEERDSQGRSSGGRKKGRLTWYGGENEKRGCWRLRLRGVAEEVAVSWSGKEGKKGRWQNITNYPERIRMKRGCEWGSKQVEEEKRKSKNSDQRWDKKKVGKIGGLWRERVCNSVIQIRNTSRIQQTSVGSASASGENTLHGRRKLWKWPRCCSSTLDLRHQWGEKQQVRQKNCCFVLFESRHPPTPRPTDVTKGPARSSAALRTNLPPGRVGEGDSYTHVHFGMECIINRNRRRRSAFAY